MYLHPETYFSSNDLPVEISSQLPYQSEHLYQLNVKKLTDKHKLKNSYKINEHGISCIKPMIKKDETKELIERLEFDKLHNEVYNLQKSVDDYEASKKRSIRNEYLTIAAVLLSLISLLIQWLTKKSG